MMNAKTIKAPASYGTALSDDPWDKTTGQPKMVVRIPGLIPLEGGLFEIEGAARREIDWDAMRAALGGHVSDMHADLISAAVMKGDIIMLLADRTEMV